MLHSLKLGMLAPRLSVLPTPHPTKPHHTTSHHSTIHIDIHPHHPCCYPFLLVKPGTAHVREQRRARSPAWKMLLDRWSPGNLELRTWCLAQVYGSQVRVNLWLFSMTDYIILYLCNYLIIKIGHLIIDDKWIFLAVIVPSHFIISLFKSMMVLFSSLPME